MMHVGYTYDADDSADSRTGIKLKASEPLSPNAFVQIPAEPPHVQQTAVHMPAARQKKMRVPHGGSVERPVQRTPRHPAPSVSFEEPAPAIIPTAASPSLHIFLESDQEEEPAVQKEQPESLAQFVASFPKIPDGLIFQSSADDDKEADASDAFEDEGSHPDLDDEPHTLRFDEEEDLDDDFDLYPDEPPFDGQDVPRMTLRRGAPPSGRVKPINPRFEKMIRDATASRPAASMPMGISADLPNRAPARGGRPYPAAASRTRTQAVSGPVGAGVGNAARAGMASPSPRDASLGRNSAPIPQRSQAVSGPIPQRGRAQSGPLPSRATGSMGHPSANLPKEGSRAVRNGANMPASAVGGSRSGAASRSNAVSRVTPHPMAQPTAGPVTRSLGSSPQPSVPSGGASDVGVSYLAKPLLDPHAIEESTIFDEPPISIAEGMKDADKSHKKGRKFALIGAAVVVVAAIGAFFVFGNQGSIVIPEITITTTDPNAKGSGDTEGSGGSNASEEPSGSGEATATGAGSVTYKYTAKTPSGIEYTVEENTTFNAQGECTFTTMKMQFPTESAAKDYTDSLARDLGSKYTLDSLDGANATITIDNSALGLDRQDYENALRYSVDDLVILKK